MNRIISILLFALSVTFAGAQNNISSVMEQYIGGCDKLLTSFDSKDLADVSEAKLLLSKPRLTSYQDFELVNSSDSCLIFPPAIIFTPDYAREIIKSGIISDPREQTNPYIMRKGDDFDLQIWNAAIAPNSNVTFKGVAIDDCEMLLLSDDNAGLKLAVISDFSSSPVMSDNHLTEHCEYTTSVWHMKEQGNFFFTISNTSDKKQTFVIAIN